MDRGAWWTIVLGVAKESDMTEQLSTHAPALYGAPGGMQESTSLVLDFGVILPRIGVREKDTVRRRLFLC